MTLVILRAGESQSNLRADPFVKTREHTLMSDFKAKAAAGADWTGLLADPDLAKNLGKLLQAYRDAPPELRDETLLAAMREIKRRAMKEGDSSLIADSAGPEPGPAPSPGPLATPASSSPPFEPDIFSSTSAQDRRRASRIKCFVAVELRVNDGEKPIWGNLSNTGLGGCQVETAQPISGGSKVEIGLWVATGKIWVKGLALNGVVTRSAASGVRVRFAVMDTKEKENLRQFLKYVQETTRASNSESSYLQMLK